MEWENDRLMNLNQWWDEELGIAFTPKYQQLALGV